MASTPGIQGLRDIIRDFVPSWLADNAPAISYGFRTLWAFARFVDLLIEVLVQGEAAAAAQGTPTAVPYLEGERGILQGQGEPLSDYAARLRKWIDYWKDAGSALAVARSIHDYLSDRPLVRVITRGGHWVQIAENGDVFVSDSAWDWDSVSNPERAGYWSEIWIIVQRTTPWSFAANWGDGTWEDETAWWGFGHDVTPQERDALLGEIAKWKSAHTKVRAVIWTDVDHLPSPDGTWGMWGDGEDTRGLSGRDLEFTRYWEIA